VEGLQHVSSHLKKKEHVILMFWEDSPVYS